MTDLIWIGNTLLPRGTVILVAILVVLVIASIVATVLLIVRKS